jgi:magnesium-transporting ATPase (P-type)
MIWRISFVSVLLALGTIALFLWEREQGGSIELARTVAINALVVGEMMYLFNCRYLLAPVCTWQDLTGNAYLLLTVAILSVIQLTFTYLPIMQSMFGVVALDAEAWVHIVGFGVLLFAVVEVEKMFIRILSSRLNQSRSKV